MRRIDDGGIAQWRRTYPKGMPASFLFRPAPLRGPGGEVHTAFDFQPAAVQSHVEMLGHAPSPVGAEPAAGGSASREGGDLPALRLRPRAPFRHRRLFPALGMGLALFGFLPRGRILFLDLSGVNTWAGILSRRDAAEKRAHKRKARALCFSVFLIAKPDAFC